MRNPRRPAFAASASTSAINGAAAASPAGHESGNGLTIVIKLGTSSIVSEKDLQTQLALLSAITEAICSLRKCGHRVVLVSSGAIAMGLKRMEMSKKPKLLPEKQALAAIGQGRLIALWDNLFSLLDQPIAQVLLTRSDISDRSRYLNSTKTLSALLNYGVVPIVNENDTVSVSEIKFGDNDTLSAITASMVQADYLFLLTDVDCLYTENPRRFPDTAKPVRIVRDIEKLREMVSTATLGSSLGTGGMETKLIAAELATGAGVATVITHGQRPSSILDIVTNQTHIEDVEGDEQTQVNDDQYISETPLHTIFVPRNVPLSDRRWWVAHGLKPRGRIIIDEGAYRAIARPSSTAPVATTSSSTPARSNSTSGSSGNGGRLLAAGVIAVEGTFAAGQAVTVVVQKKKRKVRQENGEVQQETRGRSQPSTPVVLAMSSSILSEASHSLSTPEQSRPPSPSHDTARSEQGEEEDEAEEGEEEQIEFGRGLANYNYQEIDKIKGHKSSEIEKILGYIEAEHCVECITSLKRLDL